MLRVSNAKEGSNKKIRDGNMKKMKNQQMERAASMLF
jgi:hypothetical protein